ncbi:MAG: zinc-ribbon domain-containing protein [Eubacterium sp.]|nr:zinc-ribbon domain-containing protein [Candidatus Colimonas fimequi]
MYCKNCGKEVPQDSRFCMFCGTPVEIIPETIQTPEPAPAPAEPAFAPEPVAPVREEPQATEIRRERPVFEEIKWNVSEYPDSSDVIQKTEDIDFNWNANPADIPEPVAKRELRNRRAQVTAEPMDEESEMINIINGASLESELFGDAEIPEEMSAAERIDKFYTFNRKNEEFQQLLNREYSKVKSGNAIGAEMTMADEIAAERFESRANRPKSMEDFLEEEGVVKPYQPKAFESDVLQRIEAQEAAREAKRLEEEARAKALEEARREAEAKKLAEIEEARKAAEAAKLKAEEEAREAARLAEEARLKAEAEAKARAEELARREAEEARIRAEEEARRIAEEEARIKAEAVARYQAAEEARIKAEEELKAAQEAAKIKAQQEARKAAEAQARFEAEQEQRRIEAREAQLKLEADRLRLEREANETIAEEEARKIIAQTARMRDEEAAKIKAAVASLRSGAGVGAARSVASSKEVAEAHRATQQQISDMAKARSTFFGGFSIADELSKDEETVGDLSFNDVVETPAPAPAPEPVVEPVAEPSFDSIFDKTPAKKAEPVIEKVEVTGRDTMLRGDLSATRVVDKDAIMSGISDATISASRKQFADMANVAPTPAPAPVDEPTIVPAPVKAESKVSDIDDLLSQLETVEDDVDEELARQEFDQILENVRTEDEFDFDDFEDLPDEEPTSVLDDLAQLDEIGSKPAPVPAPAPVDEPTMVFNTARVDELKGVQDLSGTREFDFSFPDDKPADATIVIGQAPAGFEDLPSNDFDSYGEDIVQQSKPLYEEVDVPAPVEEPAPAPAPAPMSKKEMKAEAKAAKAAAKAEAKAAKIAAKEEAKAEGGKGSIVLKIVLILLCLVLAAEVAGIAVHFVAPQSKIAELVDTQLNTVLHKITGDDTDYSVFSEERRTVPLDDKTTLIEANADLNYQGNIKDIVWNKDLRYTDEDGQTVSDLVLSMPITEAEWGRDADNYSVYYDDKIVGEVIAYESSRYAWLNGGDEKVMEYIDKESGLYSTLKHKKNAGSGTFERLEIGEIRTGGSAYFVWVNEVMSDQTVKKVLKMNPGKGYTMLMCMAYTLDK